MVSYWTRIVCAWLLLHFASRVMKDAEKLLTRNWEVKEVPPVAVVTGDKSDSNEAAA